MFIRFLGIFLALNLAGCTTPPLEYRGVPATTVTVGEDTFNVHVNGNNALAIRTNTAYRPRLSAVARQGQRAIEIASGCRVVGPVTGDQAVIHAVLDC